MDPAKECKCGPSFSGTFSQGAPHVAPELLTKIWILPSRFLISSARASHPAFDYRRRQMPKKYILNISHTRKQTQGPNVRSNPQRHSGTTQVPSRSTCPKPKPHGVYFDQPTAAARDNHSKPETTLTSFSCFSFRDAMYTFAPFRTRAAAIIVPIPDPPPVTSAVLFATPKSEPTESSDVETRYQKPFAFRQFPPSRVRYE